MRGLHSPTRFKARQVQGAACLSWGLTAVTRPSLLSLGCPGPGADLFAQGELLRGWAGPCVVVRLQQVTHQEPCVCPGAGNHQAAGKNTSHVWRALAEGLNKRPKALWQKLLSSERRMAKKVVTCATTILKLSPREACRASYTEVVMNEKQELTHQTSAWKRQRVFCVDLPHPPDGGDTGRERRCPPAPHPTSIALHPGYLQ